MPCDLRRHDEESAGRQRAREAHQARLVDAELVHAVHHDDAGRETDASRRIHSRRDGLAVELEGFVARFYRMDIVVGDPAAGMGIGNARKQRGCAEIILGSGIEQNQQRPE